MERLEQRVSVVGGTFLARVFEESAACPRCGELVPYQTVIAEEVMQDAYTRDNEFLRNEHAMAREDALQLHFADVCKVGRHGT